MAVKSILLAAMDPNVFMFCLGKDGQVLYQPSAFFIRLQLELGGLSGAAEEQKVTWVQYLGLPLQRSSRRAGKQLCEDLREVQFKRFSIPEWNKSQGDLTIFLKENRKKKSYRDDSKASASVSAFLIFHLVLQHISLFKTGEEVILKHCFPERPKFSLLTLAKCLFSLFFFLLFSPPQNRFCPKGNTFKLNTFLWRNWLFPQEYHSSGRRLHGLRGSRSCYQLKMGLRYLHSLFLVGNHLRQSLKTTESHIKNPSK